MRSVFLLPVFMILWLNNAHGQATAVTSTVTANPATIPTGGSTLLTVQLRNSDGSKVTTGGATVSFTAPAAGSIGSVTDNNDGTYSAIYTAPGTAGMITITPRLSGTDFSNKGYVIVGSGYTIDGTGGSNSVRHDFSTTGSLTLSQGFFVDYLIVGGGGGGAYNKGGGGGGGGVQMGRSLASAISYPVTVGAGGAASSSGNGGNGSASSVLGISASAGNGGTAASSSGGSSGNGYSGGAGTTSSVFAGGGGGGASQNGSNASSAGGAGGAGLASAISGSAIFYGGGGGGGSNTASGSFGGSGGGGNGAANNANGLAGTSNRGGGGGGGGDVRNGGAGGSGTVILRYEGSSVGSVGGTVTEGTVSATGYTLHTFTTTGASTFNLSAVDLASRLGSVLSGVISGSGDLTYSGPGKVTLSANNTYTGQTIITSGTVQVGGNTAAGSLGSGNVELRSGTALIHNRSDDVRITNGFSLPGSGTRTLQNDGSGALTISGSNTIAGQVATPATLTIAGPGDIIIEQAITNLSIEKNGNGTLTLAAASNGYAGSTTVNAGTLKVTGVSGTGPVTIKSGAKLTGSGTIKGAATIESGATIMSEAANAQLTFDQGLTLNGGSHFNWTTAKAAGTSGVDWDHLQVNGTLTINATSSDKININIWSVLADGTDGEIVDFKPTESSYTWTIASATAISGFAADKFNIVRTPNNGTNGLISRNNADGFSIVQDGNTLQLRYSPPNSQILDGTDDVNINTSPLNFTTSNLSGTLTLGVGLYTDYLIVGGGGGGAGNKGGGGGGGGVQKGSVRVTASNYTVTVGSGGAAGSSTGNGAAGTSSSVFGITASPGNGGLGGSSSGGASGNGAEGGAGTGATYYTGGGGAGSGQRGAGGTSAAGGAGGAGMISDISGTAVHYGGGGGGGSWTGLGSFGGAGGGGNGASASASGAAGTSNRGGGGGGGGNILSGGAGGSGLVIIRYEGTSVGNIGGTVSSGTGSSAGYTIHTFTSGGQFNLTGLNLASRLKAVMAGNIIGTGHLEYTGPGLLTLTGTSHTYTGATSITSGELRVNSNISSSSALTVASGATLSGTGTLPATTVSGTHAPGTSPGLQSVSGDLTYASGAIVNMEFVSNAIGTRGTDHDAVNVSGDLTFNATTTLNLVFNGSGSNVDWTNEFWRYTRSGINGWKLFEVTGNVSGLSNVTLTLASAALDKNNTASTSARNGSTPSFTLEQVGKDVYLTYTVTPNTITWIGATNNSWSTTTNWSPNAVPALENSVVIGPASKTPAFTGTGSYRQLTVNSGATLNLASSAVMSIYGDLTINGTVSGDGTLELSGAAAQQVSGTGTVDKLKVNNSSGGVTIPSGSGHMISITGVLTPTAGTLTTNGNLTLKSTASGTTRVSAPGATASISGNVVAERYIKQNANSGGSGRAWRLVSIPVSGSGTLRQFFMNGSPGRDLTQTADRAAETSNSGTPIVGHNYGSAPAATGAGFDWIGVANQVSSLRRYVGNATGGTFLSEHVPNLDGTTYNTAEQGYMVFVRGDRQVVFPSASNAGATTFRSTGSLKTGDQPVSVVPASTSKYTLVGNPYMSVLDLSAVHAQNSTVIKPGFWIWDANISGTHKQGAYVNVYYNGSSWVTNTGSYTNPERIESGMAFFVEPEASLSAPANITIKEAHKAVATTAGIVPFGSESLGGHGLFHVRLERPATGGSREIVDGVLIDFHKDFRTSLGDLSDREKMRNTISQGALWLSREQRILAAEGLPWPATEKQPIPLHMASPGSQPHILRLDPKGMEDRYLKAWLKDAHLGSETEIDLSSGLDYAFTGTGNAAKDSTRFELFFVEAGRPTTGGTLEPDDLSGKAGVRLWPNPAGAETVKISLGSLAPGRYEIQVLDMTGRLVLKKSIEHVSSSVGYSIFGKGNPPAGHYSILLIDQKNQYKETLRLVIE